MDFDGVSALITALGVFFTAIGGAIAWLVKQSEKRKNQERALREEYEREGARKDRRANAYRNLAEGYRLQLVKAGIDPIPPDWPEVD